MELFEKKSILIVELTRLGDLICMLPALACLRGSFPHAVITCVVQAPYAPLIRALDLDVEVVGLHSSQTIRGFLGALGGVRRMRPDIACSMSPAKRNALLVMGSGAGVKAGYLRYVNATIQYLHETPLHGPASKGDHKLSYGREHISVRSIRVCAALGVPVPAILPAPGLKPDALLEARSTLTPFLANVRKPYLVMHPFAAWEYKEWPIQSFLRLAEETVAGDDSDVVVICEEQERKRWERIAVGSWCADRIHLYVSSSILESAALIQGAELMVGNDSGPLHLAALLGIPVVGLYGPASPGLTAPIGARGVFLHHTVECSPCAQTSCVRPNDHCMKSITINEVLAAIRSLRIARTQSGMKVHA
jgi:heptosyltransferase I